MKNAYSPQLKRWGGANPNFAGIRVFYQMAEGFTGEQLRL